MLLLLLQDLVAIVAPSAEGVVPSPPPVGTASAQSEMPDSLAPPPSVPHSLADTLPFVVDLENHAVSPHAHPPLTGDCQPPPLASPPPSPVFFCGKAMLAAPFLSFRAVSGGSVTWPIPGYIIGLLVHCAPCLLPRVRVCLGVCSPLPLGSTAPSLLPTDLGVSAPW